MDGIVGCLDSQVGYRVQDGCMRADELTVRAGGNAEAPDVRLEVLHVADCPNLAPMLERLHEVTELPVATREIGTTEDAVAHGMAGSPTLLVDGVDPFGVGSSEEYGVACRIYRDERDRMIPAPRQCSSAPRLPASRFGRFRSLGAWIGVPWAAGLEVVALRGRFRG